MEPSGKPGNLNIGGGAFLAYAILPLLKLICLTVIGLLLAHPKTKIVPKATFKLLCKLVFALFLPCTIFIHLGEAITLKNFTLWWFIPVNVVLSVLVGSFLGFLVTKICKTPPEFKRFTIIATAFGNSGNLSLAIIGSVCHSPENLFGPDCHSNGVAYVSFSQWVSVLLVYTLVYLMMEPPLEYYEVVEEEGGEIQEQLPPASDLSRPLLLEAEWPGMEENETEHCKTPFIARIFSSVSNLSQSSIPDPGSPRQLRSMTCLAEPRVVRKMRIVAERTPVHRVLQPPMFAILLAFAVGMVPPLKSFVYGENAPLSFLTDSLEIMAQAMVPSVMLILGAMLAEGPTESRLGAGTTVGVIVARLLVLPALGTGVVMAAEEMGVLVPENKMYRFVLLLQYTTPTAILLGAVARLRGYSVREASALLFWQHLLALLSLSMYMIVYFKLLLS